MRKRVLALTALVIAAAGVLTRASWLSALGRIPLATSPLQNADVAIVPSDFFPNDGRAVFLSANLVKLGYVSHVLVDEGVPYYDRTLCDYWIPMAVQHTGINPDERFECVKTGSRDPLVRAGRLAQALRKHKYTTAIIISAESASLRWRNTFRTAASDVRFSVYGYTNAAFTSESWWRSREGRKTWLTEILSLAR
jgi:hypothetical protein